MPSKKLLKKEIQMELSNRIYVKMRQLVSKYDNEKHISIKELSYQLRKILKELDLEIEEENK